MTSSPNETLERIARRIPIQEPAYERLLRRRDRKSRNQRLVAGTVGIAVFVAAVLVVTTVGSADLTQGPADPGGAGTDPTATGPTVTPTIVPDAGWDGQGLPSEGAVPSTPEEGELVAEYIEGYGPLFVYVYADGRVITQTRSFTFVTERRLTPEGVDLVRSGAVKPRRFMAGADLHSSDLPLPPGTWADPEVRTFVPSRYAVCYYQESGEANPGALNDGYEYPSRVVGFFPAPARAILLGELTHGQVGSPASPECSGVTTDEARALVDILSDVRVEDSEGDEIIWELNMILPHGVQVGHCSPCG